MRLLNTESFVFAESVLFADKSFLFPSKSSTSPRASVSAISDIEKKKLAIDALRVSLVRPSSSLLIRQIYKAIIKNKKHTIKNNLLRFSFTFIPFRIQSDQKNKTAMISTHPFYFCIGDSVNTLSSHRYNILFRVCRLLNGKCKNASNCLP